MFPVASALCVILKIFQCSQHYGPKYAGYFAIFKIDQSTKYIQYCTINNVTQMSWKILVVNKKFLSNFSGLVQLVPFVRVFCLDWDLSDFTFLSCRVL